MDDPTKPYTSDWLFEKYGVGDKMKWPKEWLEATTVKFYKIPNELAPRDLEYSTPQDILEALWQVGALKDPPPPTPEPREIWFCPVCDNIYSLRDRHPDDPDVCHGIPIKMREVIGG